MRQLTHIEYKKGVNVHNSVLNMIGWQRIYWPAWASSHAEMSWRAHDGSWNCWNNRRRWCGQGRSNRLSWILSNDAQCVKLIQFKHQRKIIFHIHLQITSTKILAPATNCIESSLSCVRPRWYEIHANMTCVASCLDWSFVLLFSNIPQWPISLCSIHINGVSHK